jgi:uncharacterized membrane protein
MSQNTTKRTLAVRLNIWVLKLSRHWLRVALIVLAVYISLPWVAPTLMKIGLTGPAQILYTLYSPFCHQFAFRSFFLFGEQPAYPRYNTGLSLKPFESYAASLPDFAPDHVHPLGGRVGDIYAFTPGFQFTARDFVGDPEMGYKMTLCERDIAIYTALLIGGLIFSRLRRRLRPVPIYLYVILGVLPIGLDGFSQMLGYPPFSLWPARETLPGFRVLTGALFGLMNAWLAFPYLEMSFNETRQQVETKLARAGLFV